ncbi:cilia- and flagella-associated protein 251 [Mugil cephalus]|uniref:cilia- and flagella-associated protein 251 n=1 Tax=Mugil cephalus TaxID=48193 RepID=UPI001FB66943|nr:cilia- and flagella-associated protein 251 [Mugil cephalus]
MNRYHSASSALTVLVLLTVASYPHLSNPNPLTTFGIVENPNGNDPLPGTKTDKEEEAGELFKDVDPKKLAAVLLEALNRSQVARRWEGDDGREGGMKAERGEDKKEEARKVEEARQEGDLELELLKAAQGKNWEIQEDEERKRVQEEEEKMTEKVTSHTTTQTIQSQTTLDGKGEDGQGTDPKRGSGGPDQGSGEKEDQLSPEELKCLETVMEEFPHLDTKRDSEWVEQKSRDYRRYSGILPAKKANDLAMSKKKLKWQEETQKAMNFPTFRGGNFIDESEDGGFGNNVADDSRLPDEQVEVEDEPEEGEDSDEVLSPEEEEARAKVEQEEMRRQAAEAQRAKMEEEKLADIASDMLLRYMVKQSNGNRKYSWSLSNAAEDKRSDEDQRATEEEQEDIDPQTIDKLIEISSRLHLPADDVVDIISDAERKKKKDVAPLPAVSSSFPSASLVSTKQSNFPVSNQMPPPVNLLKTWFQEKTPRKPDTLWGKPGKPFLASWQKNTKPQSVKQDPWFTSPRYVWTGHSFHPYTFPSFYQRNPYYNPIYVPPPRRARPRYNTWKPALRLNNFLGNSVDDPYTFLPKRRYHGWVQPQLRKPPAGLQQKSYYSSYPLPRLPPSYSQRDHRW